jgi:hypothetical protein
MEDSAKVESKLRNSGRDSDSESRQPQPLWSLNESRPSSVYNRSNQAHALDYG